MYIIKNAFNNIFSSLGRNILMGLIIIVITVSSGIGLTIKSAAEKLEKAQIDEVNINASINFNYPAYMKKAQESGKDFREGFYDDKNLSLEELQKYADSEHVKEFRFSGKMYIGGKDVKGTASTTSGGMSMGPNMTGDFLLTGAKDYASLKSFTDGDRKITSGKIFDLDKNEVVISEELAKSNNLKVGDKITLNNSNAKEQEFEYTISGIYKIVNDLGGNKYTAADEPSNEIITSYTEFEKIYQYTVKNAKDMTFRNEKLTTALTKMTSTEYIIKNAQDYKKFLEEVKSKGLSSDYEVMSENASNYEKNIIPLKNTVNFANMMLFIVLSVGGLIIIVLNIFNIRERKYEVGVLSAIGMKKHKVAIQFMSEIMIVTLVAILIGTSISAVTSKNTVGTLLKDQVSSQNSKKEKELNNLGIMSDTSENSKTNESLNNIDTSMNMNIFGSLLLIGISLSILASLSSVVFITRYEPLKILSERS